MRYNLLLVWYIYTSMEKHACTTAQFKDVLFNEAQVYIKPLVGFLLISSTILPKSPLKNLDIMMLLLVFSVFILLNNNVTSIYFPRF